MVSASRGTVIELEIHTPFSATPAFLRQWQIQIQSLRRYGGRIGNSVQFHGWISRDQPERDLRKEHPWLRDPDIFLHWVDPALFEKHSYWGTAIARGSHTHRARWVLYLDADVAVVGELDSLFAELEANPAICGFPAHLDCFANDSSAWERLFAFAGLEPMPFSQYPSGEGILSPQAAVPTPPYWNLGVIVGPGEMMKRLGRRLLGEMETINSFWTTYYRCQQAVTLALAREQLPWRPLDIRYNFPNYPEFVARHAALLPEIRLLHYLGRSDELDKNRDFSSESVYTALLQRQLTGANGFLIERLRGLSLSMPDKALQRLVKRYQRWMNR